MAVVLRPSWYDHRIPTLPGRSTSGFRMWRQKQREVWGRGVHPPLSSHTLPASPRDTQPPPHPAPPHPTICFRFRYYTRLRHRFLRRKSAHLRTIVVEGVPKEMRSDSKLFTYFNTLYPDEVRVNLLEFLPKRTLPHSIPPHPHPHPHPLTSPLASRPPRHR